MRTEMAVLSSQYFDLTGLTLDYRGKHLMATKAPFDEAAQRLLGEDKHSNLLRSGFSRPDFFREIAQDDFIDNLFSPSSKQADLDLIRCVAGRLWKGDGVTGLSD